MPLTGEQVQQLGIEGSQRAKRWLESTCRAEVKWNNPSLQIKKLQFLKAGAPAGSEAQGDSFSFDLGGTLLGGDDDGAVFVAECKNYSLPGDQGTEYRAFLAKCYRAECIAPNFYDTYLWITWSPFLVNTWPNLRTEPFVRTAAEDDADRRYIALGDEDYDTAVGASVAEKLMIVVLSDAQEVRLALHGDELLHVRKALLELRSVS